MHTQPNSSKKSNHLLQIILAILCLLVAIVGIIDLIFIIHSKINSNLNPKSEGTIEEILDVNFDDISYVKVGGPQNQTEYYPTSDFVATYKNRQYQPVSQSTGGTSHYYYVCYDDQDQVIMTLVEIGNQGLVYLKNGRFDINTTEKDLYQLKDWQTVL